MSHRLKNPECYVIENQDLHLRPYERRRGPCAIKLGDPFYELSIRRGFRHEARALIAALDIEPTEGTLEGRPAPLYVELAQTRGTGTEHWKRCQDLIVDTGSTRIYAQGPPPEPSYVIVTSYKWVWRGMHNSSTPLQYMKHSWRDESPHQGKTGKGLFLTAKILAVVVGLVVVLTILYHYGSHPWALTHTKVQHGTTKTIQQACWTVTPRNIIKVWDKNQTSNLTERLEAFKEAQTSQNSTRTKNVTAGTELLQDIQVEGNEGVMLRMLQLQRKETKEVRCTWIRAENGEPGWYCTWGCRPFPGLEGEGYWEKEVVFPAAGQNNNCLTVLGAGMGRLWLRR